MVPNATARPGPVFRLAPVLTFLAIGLAWAQEWPVNQDIRIEELQLASVTDVRRLGPLRSRAVLDLDAFRDGGLTLEAVTDPAAIGSVRFYIDQVRVHQDDEPPYTITAAEGDALAVWIPPVGAFTLTVVPSAVRLDPEGSLASAMERGVIGAWFEVQLTGRGSPEEEGVEQP